MNNAVADAIGESDEVYNQRQVEQIVRGVCGSSLDDLMFAMRDHLTRPGMLPPAEDAAVSQPNLAAAYARCAIPLEQHLGALPAEEVVKFRCLLPWHLADVEGRHVLAAILEVATWRGYYDLDLAAFSAANPNARLYQSGAALVEGLMRRSVLWRGRSGFRGLGVVRC